MSSSIDSIGLVSSLKLGNNRRTRRRGAAIVAGTAILTAALAAPASRAAVVNAVWTDTGGDSLWNTATNWSPNGVPNNGTNTYNVSIGTPSPTVLTISPTINNLTMNSGGILNIQYGNTLTLNGPSLVDNGSIVVNVGSNGAGTELAFAANTAITGSGTITLNQSGANSELFAGSGIAVSQAASHTIAGWGLVNMALTNNGVVNANVNGQTLVLGTTNETNNLTFEASNGGTLNISGMTVTQGASGVISALTGSAVVLSSGATVSAGTLSTTGTGYFSISGTDTLAGVTNNGLIDIPFNNQLNISGNLVDNGSILVNSGSNGATTTLNFSGGTLSGSGSINLNQSGNNAQLDGTLTQSAGHSITGWGQINAALTNNGLVNANVTSQTLYLATSASTNNTTMEATNGGTLDVNGIALNQAASATLYAGNSSAVTLNNATINSGILNSAPNTAVPPAGNNQGIIYVTGATTLNGVTNSGLVYIPYGNTLSVAGNLLDNGTIELNSNSGGVTTFLNFSGGTVSGTGTILMQQSGVDAQINGTFTQASGHTISGYGEINGAFTNQGLINANVNGQTLYIESPTVTNTKTMEATGGGGLYFDNRVVVTNTGGTINAAGGNVTFANGTTISGGTLNSSGGSVFTLSTYNSTVGYSALVTGGLTIATGTEFDVPYYNVLSITSTTLTNNGVIVDNSQPGGAQAEIIFNANTLLTGTGSIRLQQGGANALIATGTGDTLTQDIHHSIVGYGEVAAALVNNNVVNANSLGNTLSLDTNNKTNNLTFEATAGGTLNINGITVTQGTSGLITAATGSTVVLNNTNVSSGSLTSAGTGVIVINGATTFAGVTNSGLIDIPFYNTLSITGNLVDNGTIIDNSQPGGAVAQLNFSGGTVSGTGTIVLQQGGNNAQINGPFTQSSGHSITGYGQINGPMTNNGTINSNINGETLTLAAAMTNNSLLEATGGGTINVSNVTIANTNGQIVAGTASAVNFFGSTVVGGTLSGAGLYTITNSSVTTFNGVSSSSTINIPYYNTLNIIGNLVDNGTIIDNSQPGGAVAQLNFSGGTLSGTGSVILQQGANNAQINGSLTQAAGHTIKGYGQINAVMTNNGIIDSNIAGQGITIAAAMTNNNLIEVPTSTANLTISGTTITQGSAGQINASSGATVSLVNSTVSGGTLTGAGIWTVGGSSTLSGLTSNVTIDIPYYNVLNIAGTVVDNGSIIDNSQPGGAVAAINSSGGTIAGTGTITLQQGANNAQINGPITQSAGHTVAGYGSLNGGFTNAGNILANVSGQGISGTGFLYNTGTINVSTGAFISITGTVNTSGGIVNVPYGSSFGATNLNVLAGGTVTANGTITQSPIVTDAGTLNFGAANTAGILVRTLGSLGMSSGGHATVGTSALHTNRTFLMTGGLTFGGTAGAWQGQLDLGGNDMDVAGGSLSNVFSFIKQGYANSAWTGQGIISSAAKNNTTGLTTLGVLLNNDGSGNRLFNSFDGQTVSLNDVLVKYTYYGDANLDGVVNGSDYTKIDNGFNNGLTGWSNGDFNYDGVINGSDYTLIDNAYNTQGGALDAGASDMAASSAAQVAGFSSSSSAVPEPASLGLLAVVVPALISRRRRNSK